MITNQRAIELNPAGYALHEIDVTLNNIEGQVRRIKNCINIDININLTDVEPCSCCGFATCCCTLMCCVMCLPCTVGSVVFNILSCGRIDAQKQAQIDAIQPDQNEMYAITQLKENLRDLQNQRGTLFVPKNTAIGAISLIDNILTSSAIRKLRPFLETLRANISSAHGLVCNPTAICEIIAMPVGAY